MHWSAAVFSSITTGTIRVGSIVNYAPKLKKFAVSATSTHAKPSTKERPCVVVRLETEENTGKLIATLYPMCGCGKRKPGQPRWTYPYGVSYNSSLFSIADR